MTLDREDMDAIVDAVARGINRSRVSRALDGDDMAAIEGAVERGVTASRNKMWEELNGAIFRVGIGAGIIFLLWKYGLDILGFIVAMVYAAGKALGLWT